MNILEISGSLVLLISTFLFFSIYFWIRNLEKRVEHLEDVVKSTEELCQSPRAIAGICETNSWD